MLDTSTQHSHGMHATNGAMVGVEYAAQGVSWQMEVLFEKAEDFPSEASVMLKSTSESEMLPCRSLS